MGNSKDEKYGINALIGDAVILAGGKSIRMGFDKQLIRIDGNYLILDHIEKLSCYYKKIWLSCNRPMLKYHKIKNVSVIRDDAICIGPLAGIYTGLKHASSEYVFVLACDNILNIKWLDWMISELVRLKTAGQAPLLVIAEKEENYFEPLNAIYHRRMLGHVALAIEKGEYSLQKLIRSIDCKHVMSASEVGKKFSNNLFINFNTRYDIETFDKVEKL